MTSSFTDDEAFSDDDDYQPSASAFRQDEDESQGRSLFGVGRETTVELEWPTSIGAVFLPKSVALTHARSTREVAMATDGSASHVVRRRGIVCECCVHPCTINEMRQYCTNDDRKRSVPSFYRSRVLQQQPWTPSLYRQHQHQHQFPQRVGVKYALPVATSDQFQQLIKRADEPSYSDTSATALA